MHYIYTAIKVENCLIYYSSADFLYLTSINITQGVCAKKSNYVINLEANYLTDSAISIYINITGTMQWGQGQLAVQCRHILTSLSQSINVLKSCKGFKNFVTLNFTGSLSNSIRAKIPSLYCWSWRSPVFFPVNHAEQSRTQRDKHKTITQYCLQASLECWIMLFWLKEVSILSENSHVMSAKQER